jgi:hypothetical protein
MFNWDGLHDSPAVAPLGSSTAAGRAQQANQSTVQRLIAVLERHLLVGFDDTMNSTAKLRRVPRLPAFSTY